MNRSWYSLYLPTSDAQPVAESLRGLLADQGFKPFDPFPGGSGTPPGLTNTVRQFAAPPQAGWLRLLGQPLEALLPDWSRALDVPILYAWLTEQSGGWAVFHAGSRDDKPAAFDPYLHPDHSVDDLRTAFVGKLKVGVVASESPATGGALPPELLNFAQQQGVDEKKAGKMFDRLSANVFGKLGGGSEGEKDQARALMSGSGHDPWNSLDGQRVRAIAGVLRLPDNWRLPTWEAVRDAYQVHRLRARSPRMRLMPGDKESMDAVPDALDYLPIYMGK
jgi:hypothetical protein